MTKNDYLGMGADITRGGRYRYRLWRWWGPNTPPTQVVDDHKPFVNFIMLNPSTADHTHDDPTIRKCVAFAKRWERGRDAREARCWERYGGIMVTNLFAYRTASPKALKAVTGDRIGPDNADHVIREAKACALTIAAWGNHGLIGDMGARYSKLLRDRGILLYHLGLTKLNQPRHPLYLPGNTRPEIWL